MYIIKTKSQYINNTNNNNNITNIHFLNPKEGAQIFNNIKYLKGFTNNDRVARGVSNNINIVEYYCDNILEFNDNDKSSVRWLMDEMMNRLPENYRFILRNIKICKLTTRLENGYPHTHRDCIFVSEGFLSKLNKYYVASNIKEALFEQGIVIIHELVHILQREYPSKFKDLYVNYWGFEYNTKKIIGIEDYLDYNRSNPDGLDITSWILKLGDNKLICMALYNSNKIQLYNVKYVGLYLNNKYEISHIKPLSEIAEFKEMFNIGVNHYHPNEISAELISNYYLHLMGWKMDLTSRAIKQLILWFDNINLI